MPLLQPFQNGGSLNLRRVQFLNQLVDLDEILYGADGFKGDHDSIFSNPD
jgi:hypothetical protein